MMLKKLIVEAREKNISDHLRQKYFFIKRMEEKRLDDDMQFQLKLENKAIKFRNRRLKNPEY